MSRNKITEFANQISNINSVIELKKLFSSNLVNINEVLQEMPKDEPNLMKLFVLIHSKFPKWQPQEIQENTNIKLFQKLFFEKIMIIYGSNAVKAELNQIKKKLSSDLEISVLGVIRNATSILCTYEMYQIHDLYYDFDKNTKDPELSQSYLENIKQKVLKVDELTNALEELSNSPELKEVSSDNKFSIMRQECALILYYANIRLHPNDRDALIESKYNKMANTLSFLHKDSHIDITQAKAREHFIKEIRETFFTLLRSVGFVMNSSVILSDANEKFLITSLNQAFTTIKNIKKNFLLNNQEATTIANLKSTAKNQEVSKELIDIIDNIEASLPKKHAKKKSRAFKSIPPTIQEVRYIDKDARDMENVYKKNLLELNKSFAKVDASLSENSKKCIFKEFLMIKFKLALVNNDKEGAMPYFKEIEDHPLFRDYVKKALLDIGEYNDESEACLTEISRIEANLARRGGGIFNWKLATKCIRLSELLLEFLESKLSSFNDSSRLLAPIESHFTMLIIKHRAVGYIKSDIFDGMIERKFYQLVENPPSSVVEKQQIACSILPSF